MVLNLLQTHTLEQAKELVERSFGQYVEAEVEAAGTAAQGTSNYSPNPEQLAYVDIRQLDSYEIAATPQS